MDHLSREIDNELDKTARTLNRNFVVSMLEKSADPYSGGDDVTERESGIVSLEE